MVILGSYAAKVVRCERRVLNILTQTYCRTLGTSHILGNELKPLGEANYSSEEVMKRFPIFKQKCFLSSVWNHVGQEYTEHG